MPHNPPRVHLLRSVESDGTIRTGCHRIGMPTNREGLFTTLWGEKGDRFTLIMVSDDTEKCTCRACHRFTQE